GQQAQVAGPHVGQVAQAVEVDAQDGEEVGGDAAVVEGVGDVARRVTTDPDPAALRVDVGQLGLLGGPGSQRAEQALDQALAFERADAAEDRGLLVEAHPELVARDPQGQFFEAHLFPFSACEHRHQVRSSVVADRLGSYAGGMSEPAPATPVIGTSAFPRIVETSIGRTLLHTASRFYVDSVVRAGGVPVVLPVIDPADIGPLIAGSDGLVIPGAGDVRPWRYGAKRLPETHNAA